MLVGLASIFWVVKSSGFFYIGGLRRDFCFRLGDGPFVVPKRSSQSLPNFREEKLFWRLSSNVAHGRGGIGRAREKNSVAGEGEGREGETQYLLFLQAWQELRTGKSEYKKKKCKENEENARFLPRAWRFSLNLTKILRCRREFLCNLEI